MLINDIDLLRLAPALFTDAPSIATEIATASDASITGTTLSSASSDFVSSDVGAGSVAVVGGEALEVDTRTNGTTLEVSRPRVDDEAALIAPASGSALALSVVTFERRIAEAEAWVLGALGIDPAHPLTPLDETALVDVSSVERLIALRTIADAYDVAAAADPANAALAARAAHWRSSATEARHQTIAYLDLNGDGVPDATRRVDIVTFTRR